MRNLVLFAFVLGAGCAPLQPDSRVAVQQGDWRSVATAYDRERLRNWRTTFVDAVAKARSGGHGQAVAAEGALLDPDSAIAGGPIPPGDYRCRTIKVGAQGQGLDYVAYPFFRCRVTVEGERRRLVKLTGSQRQVGSIYDGDAMRDVFLGTLVLGDESRALRYGTDQDRDVAAWVERIGERHWRLVIPRPAFESRLDIIELLPVS